MTGKGIDMHFTAIRDIYLYARSSSIVHWYGTGSVGCVGWVQEVLEHDNSRFPEIFKYYVYSDFARCSPQQSSPYLSTPSLNSKAEEWKRLLPHPATATDTNRDISCLGCIDGATWDWILSLAEEYRVVKRCGRSAAVLAYFLARTSALTVCALFLIFLTGVPVNDSCSGIFIGNGAMVVIGNGSKAYLFFLRVRAVYRNSKLVTFGVGAGVFVLVSTRLASMFLVHISPLGPVPCSVTNVGVLSAISLWFNWAYDTCIFVAISVRLHSHAMPTTNSGIISLIRGYGLPRAMRLFLQDGQIYYFTVFASMLLSAVMAVSSQVSPVYQSAFTVPTIVIESNMVCKMFRSMIMRSLDPNGSLAPAEMSGFELDTSLELNIRATDGELGQTL
ncbi:hypothetical protein FIBSPDRAFT_937909 [Athelia psychrophila]|uniref:DUF6533 domain-containing protein n=1 Tax=Athelia psychrophila TaxID=1759441 RepID=A0A165ZKM3_9AGAM|nr:hypothetical protein FIBSPDRAFT_937909 [Fibularhizoctonia sp. CBS 109695]